MGRYWLWLMTVWLIGAGNTAWAVPEAREGCDSCRIQITSLEKPVKLFGEWLFTREDRAENKAVDLDTSDWKLVHTPGPWKKAYNDGLHYRVGWYRGTLEFAPELMGQEVVFLVDTYMAALQVFLDGEEIYHRGDSVNIQRYFSIQPVPVRFKITQERHVLAFRVDTILMTGVYQRPFELRAFDPHDKQLAFFQFWGGELRLIAAYVSLFFGLFFLLIYFKTQYRLYLIAALSVLVVFIFFAAPGDNLIKFISPERLLLLHYVGLMAAFFQYWFSQFFYKFYPRFTWFSAIFQGSLSLAFVYMAVTHVHLDLFQKVRSVYFIYTLLMAILLVYVYVRGVFQKKPGARVMLLGGLVFVGTGINDFLLALGYLNSVGMIFVGVLTITSCMLWVASNIFANTFLENKRLVGELRNINENLENLVNERTAQLRTKTQDIQSMLENLPEGVLTVMPGQHIHHEYSHYLEVILETKQIAEQPIMEVLFTNTNLGADAIAGVDAVFGACLEEDAFNFEMNSHLMPRELQKNLPSGTKILELSWSPIINEAQGLVEKIMICVRDVTELRRLQLEANQQRRELEIIGQILSVSQEKFHEFILSSEEFIKLNEQLIAQTDQPDPSLLNTLFRNIHTVKGNARTYGFLHLTNQVHETENEYDDLRKHPDKDWDRHHLLEQLHHTYGLIEEYAKINENKLGRKGPGRRATADRYLMIETEKVANALDMLETVDMNDAHKLQEALNHVSQTLKRIGTESLHEVLAGVLDSLPALARDLKKAEPQVTIVDHQIFIKNQVIGLLRNAFMHIFRNSLDHGIESVAERLEKGKSAQGQITIEMELDAQQLTLRYRDDGRGLALGKIRQKAMEKQLMTPERIMSASEIAQLIFHSGFSTAEQVTEVSGRGVGMDAVRNFFEREKGQVEISFLDDQEADFRPFEFVLTLPATMGVKL